MAKQKTRSRNRRGPAKGQRITTETLKKHADVLARVWMELKKKHPELTSDEFWKLLKKNWTIEKLEKAIDSFEKNGSLRSFSMKKLQESKRKRRGYWNEWANVEQELLTQIDRLGKFPSTGEMKKIGLSMLVSAIPRHGGMAEVQKKMGYLDQAAPLVDETGFARVGPKTYGTAYVIWKKLDEKASLAFVQNHLVNGNISSIRGIAQSGRTVDLYDLDSALSEMSSILTVPVANRKDGGIDHEAETWYDAERLRKKFGLGNKHLLERALKAKGVRSIQGRSAENHRLAIYYSLTESIDKCKLLVKQGEQRRKAAKAAADGLAIHDGLKFGTELSLSQALGISRGMVKQLIADNSPKTLLARDRGDRLVEHFCKEDLEDALGNYRALPRDTDGDGFIETQDKTWGTLRGIYRLKIIPGTRQKIASILKASQCQKQLGRTKNGKRVSFYLLSQARQTLIRHQQDTRPVTTELLKENADDLAMVYIRLKQAGSPATSSQLWKKIKAKWSAVDLRKAIEDFKKGGSVEAFEKLLE